MKNIVKTSIKVYLLYLLIISINRFHPIPIRSYLCLCVFISKTDQKYSMLFMFMYLYQQDTLEIFRVKSSLSGIIAIIRKVLQDSVKIRDDPSENISNTNNYIQFLHTIFKDDLFLSNVPDNLSWVMAGANLFFSIQN